jgi:hypothetical protein
MHYLVTIGYETERLDGDGNPRLQKTKYIVEAESIEEVSLRMAKYRASDSRGSESLAIAKFPIECIIDAKNSPDLYE